MTPCATCQHAFLRAHLTERSGALYCARCQASYHDAEMAHRTVHVPTVAPAGVLYVAPAGGKTRARKRRVEVVSAGGLV